MWAFSNDVAIPPNKLLEIIMTFFTSSAARKYYLRHRAPNSSQNLYKRFSVTLSVSRRNYFHYSFKCIGYGFHFITHEGNPDKVTNSFAFQVQLRNWRQLCPLKWWWFCARRFSWLFWKLFVVYNPASQRDRFFFFSFPASSNTIMHYNESSFGNKG